jgi:hypothetical protein
MPDNSTEATVLTNGNDELNINAVPGPLSTMQPVLIASKFNLSSQQRVPSADALQGDITHLVDPGDEAETRDFLRQIFSPGIPLISLNGRSLPIGPWLNDSQGVLTETLSSLEHRYRDEPNLSPAELEQDLQAMGIIRTTDTVLTEANATPQELEAIQGLLKLATDPNGAHISQDVDGPTESDCEDGELIGEYEDPRDDDYVESPAKKSKGVKGEGLDTQLRLP